MCKCYGTCLDVKEQFCKVSFFLLLSCGFHVMDFSEVTRFAQHVLSFAEPSHWPPAI